MPTESVVPGSFRDPNGQVVVRDGVLYRVIRESYREDYGRLMESGLYGSLTSAGLLIPHEEVASEGWEGWRPFKVIRPEPVGFVSYPYEWCFGQLRDAAATTLRIQKAALAHGLSLKDASAYNIQFHKGRPVLIDTLSFERRREGAPWSAYRQFCQHFLAPLALMAMTDVRLGQLLRIHIDGLPLDLASRLLPARSRLSVGLLLHLHVHAKSQRRFADREVKGMARTMSTLALEGLIDSLDTSVGRLAWKAPVTTWGDYYDNNNYSPEAFAAKQVIVSGFIGDVGPRTVWDLGANDGTFSRIAAGRGHLTMAFDLDPVAVESNYRRTKEAGDSLLLPLLLDLDNPSPALGWAHSERMSLVERGPADMVLALGLVHHLAIANNLPLASIADFLCTVAKTLVIEFVPKADSQVQRMLRSREDIFPGYDQRPFEEAFSERFQIEAAVPVSDSSRTIYLMRGR